MIRASAHAKLNLYLHVLGKRADGYHAIESLVAFADCGDAVTVEAADWLTLEAFGPYANALPPSSKNNLVMRAAKRLQEHAGTRRGAKITLEKKLPIAAGLGGGSSDAAAAVKLLCTLWNLSVSDADLAELLLPLGADIPVCLRQRPALVGGIGERVREIPALPKCYVVLVNPGKPLATEEVYRAFNSSPLVGERLSASPQDVARSVGGKKNTPHDSLSARLLPLKGGAIDSLDVLLDALQSTENHLEPAAIALMPEIRPMLTALEQTPHCLLARMSGSGPTCFGLFVKKVEATRAAAALKKQFSRYWIQGACLG